MLESNFIERYDRQIRLWGQHGQTKCSDSKVCLINADSLGAEVLKGLCLAGIGSFTILDSHKLTPEDVGCNFLPQTSIGRGRAESVRSMLLDLNEEVKGEVSPLETYLPHITSTPDRPSEDLPSDLNYWKQFNCVIASGLLYIDQIIRLSKICWDINLPLILCKSIGFYGIMRIQIKEHLIIEAHLDNPATDFNFSRPFESLKDYFKSIEIDRNELDKIGSYPYAVIIYKYLKEWQKKKGFLDDRLPQNYTEKKELRDLISDSAKELTKMKAKQSEGINNSAGQEMPFENFLEASKAVNTCFSVPSGLPKSVEDIFNHPNTSNSSLLTVSRFWSIIRAIKEFVTHKNEGRLPINGSIPDMIASSEEYIKLQNIYADKAKEDVQGVFSIVQTLIDPSSFSTGSSLYSEAKLICKNIRDLKIIQTSPIYEDYDFKTCYMREGDEEDELTTIGLCLKAIDIFSSIYGRLPGCQFDQVETDITKLKDCVKQMIGKVHTRLTTLDQCSYELCRYGGAELHTTSAFLGGCIVQEVIKLITNQYFPVDNTMVYNATSASTKSFRLSDILLKD